jgi:hypothetical protein
VLARANAAALGERVVQPSPPDEIPACGPSPARDVVATLSAYEPLKFDGSDNVMDAAIAELNTKDFVCATPAGYYGALDPQPADAALGLAIQKLGRTTGLTAGTVTAINAKVKLTYPGGSAQFVGLIKTSKSFGDFGDSGALVVTQEDSPRAVGLVIGGTSQGVAFLGPIAPVLARFGVTICTP